MTSSLAYKIRPPPPNVINCHNLAYAPLPLKTSSFGIGYYVTESIFYVVCNRKAYTPTPPGGCLVCRPTSLTCDFGGVELTYSENLMIANVVY